MALCPAHDDKNPSLHVEVADDGKILLHCFAGCSYQTVTDALGLDGTLLAGHAVRKARTARPDRRGKRRGWDTPEAAARDLGRLARGEVESIHHYQNADGVVECVVVRIRTPDGKSFRPLHVRDGRWHLGDPDQPLPLYRLLRARDAKTVLVVEGEKCVDVAEDIGVVATTSAHGASSAHKTDWGPLRGKEVTILPDNDAAGRRYAIDVGRILARLDPPATVQVLELDGLPDGGDLADWCQLQHDRGLDKQEIAESLAVRLEQAIPFAEWHSAYSAYSTGGGEASTSWPTPRPVPRAKAPPPFPIGTAFPPSCVRLKDFIQAVAESYQVPVDLPAMLGLAACGLAVSRTAEVAPLPDWREPLAIYALVLLPSGERKSPVFARMIGPIRDWQRQRGISMALDIASAENDIKIVKEQLSRRRASAARGDTEVGDGESMESLLRKLADLEARKPKAPSLIATEATTEAIGDLLADNEERGMLAAAEGDVLDVMLGRYGHGKPNFGLWLSGHAGDTIEVRRKGRPTLRLRRPALTVALAVQEAAISDLMASRAAAGRGVLARFLFSRPLSKLGYRDLQPPPIPTQAADWYGARLHQLLDRKVPGEPTLLRLSKEADQLFLEFRQRIETELRPDGKFCDHTAWGAKLAGAVARIAGVMHSVAHPDGKNTVIDEETMGSALSWAPYLEAHERHVAWLAGDDGVSATAERILAWIRRHGHREFSHNECYNGVRGSVVRKAKDIDAGLALLEELGWIRPLGTVGDGPRRRGRPPGPRYEVNPETSGPTSKPAPQNTQNAQKPPKDLPSEDQPPTGGGR